MDFQTPPAICNYMSGLVPFWVQTVLEPTPGCGNLVNALRNKGFRVSAPTDIFKKQMRRYDAIVMNPPFTPMQLGYDILFRCMDYSDHIIALMPWLTLINGEARAKKIRNFGLKSVTHLPRNAFPGTRVQTCILEMKRGYTAQTRLVFY